MDYRERIYSKYASNFQDAPKQFNEKEATRWGKAYDYFFRTWLPHDKEADVIDLACGGGKLLFFFKERGYKNVFGVDISPEQAKLSRQICTSVTEDNILHYLESRTAAFDLITGLDIIEHFYKEEALLFLDRSHTALKPGGRLILQTPNADSPWGTMHRYNDFTHEICFNPNALMRLLSMCGFSNIESRELGPVPCGYSPVSTIRYLLWQSIRCWLKMWNMAETGNKGSGVFTRVFLVTGVKRA